MTKQINITIKIEILEYLEEVGFIKNKAINNMLEEGTKKGNFEAICKTLKMKVVSDVKDKEENTVSYKIRVSNTMHERLQEIGTQHNLTISQIVDIITHCMFYKELVCTQHDSAYTWVLRVDCHIIEEQEEYIKGLYNKANMNKRELK